MPSIYDAVRAPEVGDIYLPPEPLSLQFRHRTVGGTGEHDNVEFPWYWTRLDHPALNGRPQAIVTATPVGRVEYVQQTAHLVHNPHPIGVLYRDDHWYIYNLGLEAMELRADFHVAIHEARRPE